MRFSSCKSENTPGQRHLVAMSSGIDACCRTGGLLVALCSANQKGGKTVVSLMVWCRLEMTATPLLRRMSGTGGGHRTCCGSSASLLWLPLLLLHRCLEVQRPSFVHHDNGLLHFSENIYLVLPASAETIPNISKYVCPPL